MNPRTSYSIKPVKQQVITDHWQLITLVAQRFKSLWAQRELPLVHVVFGTSLFPVVFHVVGQRKMGLDRVGFFVFAFNHRYFHVMDATKESRRIQFTRRAHPIRTEFHPSLESFQDEGRPRKAKCLNLLFGARCIDLDDFNRLEIQLLPLRWNGVDRIHGVLFLHFIATGSRLLLAVGHRALCRATVLRHL